MSQQEFENYLTLLSRLLKVAPAQREQLAQEFRAHLEDRLEELLDGGMQKDKAVQLAIGEFGDAAALAAELAQVAKRKRRRIIMRMSLASAAALAAAGLVAIAFWPDGGRIQGPPEAIAQADAAQAVTKPAPTTKGQETDLISAASKKIEAALNQEAEFNFSDTPIKDVAEFLAETYKINVVLAMSTLTDAGINADTPVTSNLRGISLRSALRIVLEEHRITYVIRDEVLQITTQEDADSQLVTRVYDCRELLALEDPPGSGRTRNPMTSGGMGGGFFAVQSEPATKSAPGAGEAPGDVGGAAPEADGAPKTEGKQGPTNQFPPARPEETSADRLIKLITRTVEPDGWDEVGGPGNVAEYKGMLAISQTREVHEKVERLLNMLHESAGLQAQRVNVVE